MDLLLRLLILYLNDSSLVGSWVNKKYRRLIYQGSIFHFSNSWDVISFCVERKNSRIHLILFLKTSQRYYTMCFSPRFHNFMKFQETLLITLTWILWYSQDQKIKKNVPITEVIIFCNRRLFSIFDSLAFNKQQINQFSFLRKFTPNYTKTFSHCQRNVRCVRYSEISPVFLW